MSGDWKSGVGGGLKDAAGAEGSFSVTSSTSWFERVKGAFAGVVVGLALVPASVGVLFWNEGRAVQTARSLSEGAGAVQAAEAGRVDAALDGRLVHVSGPLTVGAALRDPDFPVEAAGAVRLLREVEMFQWREERRSETRTALGGSQETVTTYSYTRGWSPTQIDSSRFQQPDGRRNPQMRYAARNTVAPEARLGARRLTGQQLSGFGEAQPLVLNATTFLAPYGTRVIDGALYIGQDPANPQVGDMRIRFAQVPAGPASIVARQAGDGFAPYQTQGGDQIMMLVAGIEPASQMFRRAEEGNRILTWILRGVGALLMCVGFGMVLRPLSVLGSVVPFIGSVIGAGAGLVSLMLTMVLAPITIAVAWFWYRPLVSVVVLVVGLGLAFLLSRVAAKRRAAAPAAA